MLYNRSEGKHWTETIAKALGPAGVIAVSHDTARFAEKVYPGIPHLRCIRLCLWSRVTMECILVMRCARLGSNQEKVVIIQVSRMESWKGHLTLLRALGRLNCRPEWELWVVGGVERGGARYYHQLQDNVVDLGIAEELSSGNDRIYRGSSEERHILSTELRGRRLGIGVCRSGLLGTTGDHVWIGRGVGVVSE